MSGRCRSNDVIRTTNGTGKVSELTLEEIRRLDAGSWFDPKFAGEKVPTIEDVLKLVAEYQQHDVLIAVDLKAVGVAAGKRALIAGITASGNVPENWQRAMDVGIDGILTDYPLELAAMRRKDR